jgi:adenylosuccinate synthase
MSSRGSMPNTVVVGLQWGDEGKGKVVDHLAAHARWVVRFQGGNNAGHTLVVNGEKVVLHVVPSGILQPGATCVVAGGVVIDPAVFCTELDGLVARGVGLDRLRVSTEAFVILPSHRAVDAAREDALGAARIGTTRRGIGPAYEDKVARRGVRVGDLLDPARLDARLRALLPVHAHAMRGAGADPASLPSLADTLAWAAPLAARLRPLAADTVALLHGALERGEPILFEGAQGTLLDLDHGTYPFVTSSTTLAGGVCAGAGVGPRDIGQVVGVAKAYATRVGEGPFPTEIFDAAADHIRRVGAEFGSTTGRPRRCGWLDIPLLRHAVRLNGVSALALTKLDVLSGLPAVRLCVGHRGPDGQPCGAGRVAEAEPVYEELPGWAEPVAGVTARDDLPAAARAYLARVEALVGVPIVLLGTGPRREDLWIRPDMDPAAPRP